MGIVSFFESLPSALYGIIIGSLLTIIGVVLTNASNTKRLRLQHEHEQKLANKARDLNLRRDVYMQAMEAISAGLVAVGRFSELDVSSDALMRSYTDLSPKIGKVTIVGKNETIKAMATFNQELTGTFLRLSAKRENFKALHHHADELEQQIEMAKQEQATLKEKLHGEWGNNHNEAALEKCRKKLAFVEQKLSDLKSEHDSVWEQLLPLQMALVKDCLAEVARLDQLLVPLVGMMRSELELPFNQSYYAEILRSGHEKQKEYLEAFFQNFDDKMTDESDQGIPAP